MALDTRTSFNLSGNATTAGAAEETLNLSLNGVAAAASVAVAAGTEVSITDVVATGAAAGAPINFRLQQTNDGAAWFDLVNLRLASDGTVGTQFGSAITITGGANVAVRARVETTAGAGAVTVNVQGNRSS